MMAIQKCCARLCCIINGSLKNTTFEMLPAHTRAHWQVIHIVVLLLSLIDELMNLYTNFITNHIHLAAIYDVIQVFLSTQAVKETKRQQGEEEQTGVHEIHRLSPAREGCADRDRRSADESVSCTSILVLPQIDGLYFLRTQSIPCRGSVFSSRMYFIFRMLNRGTALFVAFG